MTARPLVSIVTPTWQRHELLLEAIANVRQQDYPNLEHVIISDGPDPRLMDRLCGHPAYSAGRPPITFHQLGRNFTEHGPPNSFGVGALTAGMLLARGEHQVWLCDDERMMPDHISSLVDALEAKGADFAYSKTRMYRNGQQPANGWDIGTDPPQYGQITNFLYRSALLQTAMPAWGGHPIDWTLCAAWMAAGARWAFVPRVTLTHRADR